MRHANWSPEESYERRVGRWSRLVAVRFLEWLRMPTGLRWLDVGAGTGALCSAIAADAGAAFVVALEPALADLGWGRRLGLLGRALPVSADARALPFRQGAFDVVTSALALNFLREPVRALEEMSTLVAPSGVVTAYLWDFAGEMQPHRRFWDAAIALDPAAAPLDQANKFPLCRLDALGAAFEAAGLRDVETHTIDEWVRFDDFDDLWLPFVVGDGSVVDYTRSLGEERLRLLENRMRASVPVDADGGIRLLVRAFAARGCCPRAAVRLAGRAERP